MQLSWRAYEAFGAFEFMFHQAQAGAIAGEVWERWSATTAWWLSFPGVRAWWAAPPSQPVPWPRAGPRTVRAAVRAAVTEAPVGPATPARHDGSSTPSISLQCHSRRGL
jgi:hypothetical protein